MGDVGLSIETCVFYECCVGVVSVLSVVTCRCWSVLSIETCVFYECCVGVVGLYCLL